MDPFGTDGTPTVWNRHDGGKVYPADAYVSAGEHLNTMSWAHAYLHAGRIFRVCYLDDDFDAADTLEIVITAGVALNPHLFFRGSCTGTAKIELFPAVTGVTGGTPLTIANRNQESSNTPTATALLNPSAVVTPLPALDTVLIPGGGAGAGSSGGAEGSRDEWIYARSLAYLLRVTNLTVTNNLFASLCAEWYEHSPVGV